MQPFSSFELDSAVTSLKRIIRSEQIDSYNWSDIHNFIASVGHKSHKDWDLTEESSDKLKSLIGGPNDDKFRYMFQRVLEDGNFEKAEYAAKERNIPNFKPWVVLVTGVNGIRKTTSVYQPWLKTVLKHALGDTYDGAEEELPDGSNSFFRQLDYMIATLGNIYCTTLLLLPYYFRETYISTFVIYFVIILFQSIANEEFRQLYSITDLREYSKKKAEIFKILAKCKFVNLVN